MQDFADSRHTGVIVTVKKLADGRYNFRPPIGQIPTPSKIIYKNYIEELVSKRRAGARDVTDVFIFWFFDNPSDIADAMPPPLAQGRRGEM